MSYKPNEADQKETAARMAAGQMNLDLSAYLEAAESKISGFVEKAQKVMQNAEKAAAKLADKITKTYEPPTGSAALWANPYDDYKEQLRQSVEALTTPTIRNNEKDDEAAIMAGIQGIRNDLKNQKVMVEKKPFANAVVDYSGKKMRGYIGKMDDKETTGYGW